MHFWIETCCLSLLWKRHFILFWAIFVICPLNVDNGQNPRRHVILKKPAKCVQHVHRLEGICQLVFIFTSASLHGGGTFLKVTKFICNRVYNNKVYIYKYQSYNSKVKTYLRLYVAVYLLSAHL